MHEPEPRCSADVPPRRRSGRWPTAMAVAALAGGIPAGMLPVAGPGAEAAALPGRPASGTVPAAPQEGTSEGGVVTVNESGFGHGVGMSQYGALGMARA